MTVATTLNLLNPTVPMTARLHLAAPALLTQAWQSARTAEDSSPQSLLRGGAIEQVGTTSHRYNSEKLTAMKLPNMFQPAKDTKAKSLTGLEMQATSTVEHDSTNCPARQNYQGVQGD
ncbi:uncharacterized protein LY89DRAFT_735940 [Mollisia scopiformis]|uniref:Uncharacterized protein n=1 Tax=Mollisia scopiformis TaxID=149040 RepID=A0A194X3W0_MOLSC|nr:uncharacterized protein LY89DRAFT_735940 [Mollisia scopiformis]KUJ14878.1 hypothetical protein LY89DRAFT_735940 [Mollisia scopiformis]